MPRAVTKTRKSSARRRNNRPPARIGSTTSPDGAQSAPTTGRNMLTATISADSHHNDHRGVSHRLDRMLFHVRGGADGDWLGAVRTETPSPEPLVTTPRTTMFRSVMARWATWGSCGWLG